MKDYHVGTSKQLGQILKGFRKTRKLTQDDVGQAIGLPQSEISKLEFDPSRAAFGRVFKLIAALDLELVVRSRDKNASHSEW